MPGPRLIIAASLVLAMVAATGCSRLSFVKPSAARGDSTQVAPTYDFIDRSRKSGSEGSVRAHLLRGEQALYQGRVQDAETEARAALEIDDGSELAHTLLALALDQIRVGRKVRQALADHQVAVQTPGPHRASGKRCPGSLDGTAS